MKILDFKKGADKIIINTVALALKNKLEVIVTIRDSKGETYHVTNSTNVKEILQQELTKQN